MLHEQTLLQKADFGAIYDQPDPRDYFSTLRPFDYAIPQLGADVFDALLPHLRPSGARPTVLDVCCSYGILPMLLTTDLTIDEIYAHYGSATGATTAQLADRDAHMLRSRRRAEPPRAIGIDVAVNAVDYAVTVGAMDAGAAENLENDDPSPRLASMLADVDLITTTGGVGYVTERTFDRLLDLTPPTVWVAAFCLRTYDHEPIAAAMERRGMRTERAGRTFRQRRFTDPDEQAWALAQVRDRGLDPTGHEDDGHYHADFFLSRPAEQVEERPLAEMVPALA